MIERRPTFPVLYAYKHPRPSSKLSSPAHCKSASMPDGCMRPIADRQHCTSEKPTPGLLAGRQRNGYEERASNGRLVETCQHMQWASLHRAYRLLRQPQSRTDCISPASNLPVITADTLDLSKIETGCEAPLYVHPEPCSVKANEKLIGVTYIKNTIPQLYNTRGADRTTGLGETVLQDITFKGVKKLWSSVLEKMAEWVENHQGKAMAMQSEQQVIT